MRKRTRTVLLPLALLVVGAGGALAAAGCIIDWADDCSHNLGGLGCKGAGAGASGSAGGTGSASSTGPNGGSGGTGAGCTDASSCPPVPAGPCAALGMATCIDHACGITYTAGNAPSQVYGDCKTNVCDATGTLSTMVDPTDKFDDGNPCTNDVCTGELAQNIPTSTAGCFQPGTMMGGFCWPALDPSSGGVLVCAQCDPSNQSTCGGVSGMTCVSGTCVPMHCTNSTKDGTETDVNCGGPDCLPCLPGQGCGTSYKNCTSLVCTAGICASATCSDGRKNGTETDVDCGGASPECPRCADLLGCSSPNDCASKVCWSASPGTLPDLCQPATCFDGVQNGSETGIDCGGPLDGGGDGDGGAPCPPCAM